MMKALLEKQRAAFVAEGLRERRDAPRSLGARALAFLHDNQNEIADTIDQDFGNRSRHQSLMSDIYGHDGELEVRQEASSGAG